MSLIVIMGPQAVGKMTVGKILETKIDSKLLFNHQTIDLFAKFLGYNEYTFKLSDMTRKELFKAFVQNKTENATKNIIFTVLIAFDEKVDKDFLGTISNIFLESGEDVYFIELFSDLETRLGRNVSELRLSEKPSKRDIKHSEKDLLETMKKHRLESKDGEIKKLFPKVHYMKIDNSNLEPEQVVKLILKKWDL
ncbi:hypothetical protein ACVVIB_12850 [Lactococcus lactis]